MKKLTVQEIESIVARVVDPQARQAIMSEVISYAGTEEEPDDQPTDPMQYRPVTILVGAPEIIEPINTDQLYAYTVSCEVQRDHNGLINHLINKAAEYNTKKKRKRSKIYRFSDVFDSLKPKSDLDMYPKRIYTKESALILKTSNFSIPQTSNAND